MKLLLHSCCGPCTVGTMEILKKEDIKPTIYWYNPNIHPLQEYILRRDCLKEYCNKENLNLIINDEYGLDNFCKEVSNNIETRCTEYCYPVRLKKTFEYAKQNGYDTVSTTLLYSIYQKHDYIKFLCEKYSQEYEIDFLYRDFRTVFWEGHEEAKRLEMYMQKYCGCIFSEEERYLNRNNTKPSIPEGYELKRTPRLQVKKIENKEDYIDMFLIADPSKDMIYKYLNDSDVYVLKKEDEIISICAILHINHKTLELKNIVTKEEYRGKGYAKILLKSLCGNYKQKYSKMIVGTTENNIPFYVKQGFDKYEKTIKNFFIDNYKDEIWDGELHCTDLIYYSKDLKKK